MSKLNRGLSNTIRLSLFGLLVFWSSYQNVWADEIPDAAYISGFIGHAQNYSLSCEARSAVDLMAFWGIYAAESDFLSGLPRTDNPETGFVGDPGDLWGNIPPGGYGVHAGPVAALLSAYGLQAEGKHGWSWDDLRREISLGHPVIVWVIGQMWKGVPQSYTSSDGQTTTVAHFEHTMVLVGYDSSWVYVVDAFSGQAETFAVDAFLGSWRVLENMAVTGYIDAPNQPAEGAGSAAENLEGNTYIVQRGDYLVELAKRFGTTWQELAVLNNIAYPYTIYPGQALKVAKGTAQVVEPAPPVPTEPPPPTATTEPTPTATPPPPSPTPEPAIILPTRRPEELVMKLFMPVVDNLSKQPSPKSRGMARQIFHEP